MVLAIIPLFFAWRSLSSYFYCAAFPLFLLIAARTFPAKRRYTRQILDQSMLWFDHNEPVMNDDPNPVDVRVAFQCVYNWCNLVATKLTLVRQGFSSVIIPSPKSAPPPPRGWPYGLFSTLFTPRDTILGVRPEVGRYLLQLTITSFWYIKSWDREHGSKKAGRCFCPTCR